jgi:hypothetical protein
MTEDEAWQEIERKQRKAQEQVEMTEAVVSAMRFINDMNNAELGIMTLRKAYEIGYRAATYAAQRRRDGHS